jgi:CheY-like chemotaxis protein
VNVTECPVDESQKALLKTVLVVDDTDVNRITTKWFLSSFGYAVVCARSAEDALAIFNPDIHDAVVTDNSMPCMSGSEMAHIIKLRSPSTPVLMVSGSPPEDRSRLDFVAQKPVHLMVLKNALDALLKRKDKTADR